MEMGSVLHPKWLRTYINNSETACICLYCVQFPKLGHPASFMSALYLGKTSHTMYRKSARLIVWHRSWHCCIWDCFPAPFQSMQRSVAKGLGREPMYVTSKVCQLEWSWGPISACATRDLISSSLQPEYSCSGSRVLMLSGEIYLRLKPYLVVEISCDIVTEHCCQVCVLSMMFCRSDCRLCAGMWWLPNQGTPCSTAWFDTQTGQRGIWKIVSTFSYHILPWQRHIGARIIPCHCITIKKILCVDPFTGNRNSLLNCWIALKRSKMTLISIHILANQYTYHDYKST